MHINLVIATPGHSVMTSYLKSLLPTIGELNKRGITWLFSSEYSSHVADAREVTLSGTRVNDISESRPFGGAVTYDKILWIDSDIAFSPDDVIKIYESPYDIVSGAYLLSNGEVTAYKDKLGKPFLYSEVLEMNEPIEISGAGMGFMAVRSGVFESLSRPWFQSAIVTVNKDEELFTFPVLGEDISFCLRAQEAGYKVWFDPTIRVIHHKTYTLTWEGIKA